MKKTLKLLLVLLCLPLLITGCKKIPKLDNGSEVVVELKDKQFTTNELYDALKKTYGTTAVVSMIDEYITGKELTAEIEKQAKEKAQAEYDSYYSYYGEKWADFLNYYGYKTNDEFLNSLVTNYKNDAVIKKYLTSDVVTDKEIETYYKENIFGEISARHILITPENKETMTDEEKKAAKEASLKEANELIEKLKVSTDLEKDFIELAKEKSDDKGSASEGGLIENFTNDSGLVKEFWESSVKLEVGKMTLEAVESEFGYHIIYKVSQKEKPTLDTVKDKVITKVVEELLTDENAKFVYWAGLREKYGMSIHDDVIKDGYDATMKNLEKKNG